jgi:hypothetical protein
MIPGTDKTAFKDPVKKRIPFRYPRGYSARGKAV